MRNVLFLAVFLSLNTPPNARGASGDAEPVKVELIQKALVRTAGALGWSSEIMVSEEADGSTGYLVIGDSGMAAIYAYGSENEATTAFEKTAVGEKSLFHGHPSTAGENAGLYFRAWRTGSLMFSIMEATGEGAEIFFSIAVKIAGDEPAAETGGIPPGGEAREGSLFITDIERRGKVISVRLTGRGLKPGTVAQGELRRSYDNTTIQRGACVVGEDGLAALHFRAPYMGWTPGRYTVHVQVADDLTAARDLEISD